MEFNINKIVRVKLTDSGIAELSRQHNELAKVFPVIGFEEFKPQVDSEGYTEFQMHDLMHRLGHLCVIGNEIPFDANIIIENDL